MTCFSLQRFVATLSAIGLLTAVPTAQALPDFTASEITTASSTVTEGDIAHLA